MARSILFSNPEAIFVHHHQVLQAMRTPHGASASGSGLRGPVGVRGCSQGMLSSNKWIFIMQGFLWASMANSFFAANNLQMDFELHS